MIEFALTANAFLFCLFAVIGVGVDAFYQQALDDAVRDATRQLQLGAQASASAGNFLTAVCSELGLLDSSCQTSLSYVVQAGTVAGGFASLTPQTLSPSGAYSKSFFSGNPFAPGVPVLVQVAYPLPFTLPFFGNVLTWTNTGSIVATAAVTAEPYQ